VAAGNILTFLTSLAITFTALPLAAANCESLASLKLANTTINSSNVVAAGSFTLPRPGGSGMAGRSRFTKFETLPSFCRVMATLTPTSDSDIKIEVWLPVSGWNGKLQSVGNGGFAGMISYPALASALADGYATTSTDTGHTGNNGSFALGHPEKLIDFGYRSAHEMTLTAKAIIAAFYAQAPSKSYWNGCSTGGRQGLAEAQLYPADYDGIIAGDPANYMTHLQTWGLWVYKAVHKNEASYIPPEKYPAIHKAVLEACDTLDGVKDGLIGEPTRCHFDPKVLTCKGDDGPSCLTSAQVDAVRKLYSAATNPRTGQEIFPGFEPGSELGWGAMAGPQPHPYTLDLFKYVVFKNPDWDFHTFNLDGDVALADEQDHHSLNDIDPNLKEFFSRDGKLLMYHGWSDPLIPPLNTVNYYESVQKLLKVVGAAKAENSMRLFMFPGMTHCGGGEGPNRFDAIGSLSQWVEKGEAPTNMIASHFTNNAVDRTRPVCPYPQVASYKGSGSTDDASNFVCKTP
jgi:Tannase and feruloyl esterase